MVKCLCGDLRFNWFTPRPLLRPSVSHSLPRPRLHPPPTKRMHLRRNRMPLASSPPSHLSRFWGVGRLSLRVTSSGWTSPSGPRASVGGEAGGGARAEVGGPGRPRRAGRGRR
eukprot:1177569-Prorocentrum_minimum.AAC.3